MTYDYDRAARDQEANEWSLEIKAQKYEEAVRAGHGTKEEMEALRKKDAEEAAAREAKKKEDIPSTSTKQDNPPDINKGDWPELKRRDDCDDEVCEACQ